MFRTVKKSHIIIAAVAIISGCFGVYAVLNSRANPTPSFDKIYGVNNAIGWGPYWIDIAQEQLGVNGDRVCHNETDIEVGMLAMAEVGMRLTMCVNSYEPMTTMDVESYADTVAEHASTYGPGGTFWNSHPEYADYAVESFEIMNEPYGWWYRDEDNDPAAFAEAAAAAIQAGKAANPNAKFYLPLAHENIRLQNGTWVNWNQAVLNADPDLYELVDGFSIHLYYTPDEFASKLDQWKNWAWGKQGGNGKPFIITEANLTDQYASPEQDYVDAMPEFVQIAEDRPWVKELFIFNWHGYSGRDYLGFMDINTNPRQARMDAYRTAIEAALAEPPADETAPEVSITEPSEGATVSGNNVTISASASDDVQVAGVQFKVNGENVGAEDTSSPYSVTWDTTDLDNGEYTITAVARDTSDNTATSSNRTVTVNNSELAGDCTKVLNPTDNFQNFLNSLQPGDIACAREGTYGARGTISYFTPSGTSGNRIVLKPYPDDDRPTILGRFNIEGDHLTTTGFLFDGPTGPISSNEDVQVWLKGSNHAVFSENEVRNNEWHAGVFVSDSENVQILRNYIHSNGQFDNPAMANLDHGIYWHSGSGVIANNIIANNYSYGIQLYTSPDNIQIVNNTITGHTGRGAIIISEDTANTRIANNIISDNRFGINVYNLNGTNNTATTNIFWNNSDGNIVGGAGLSVNNSILSNPLFAGSGDYRLTSGSPAIDSANEQYAVSPDFASVTRPQGANSDIGAYEFEPDGTTPEDTTDPSITFINPSNNATVSGIITATVNASDNEGVDRVEFSLDDEVRLTDYSSPYNYSFDTNTLTNGEHTVSATAYDEAGNSASATITINVQNVDSTPPNAPSGLTGNATDPNTIELSWNAATDAGENQTGVIKYNVLRRGPSGPIYSVIAQVDAPTTTYTDENLTASSEYSYRVQAVDGADNVSSNSNTATATTPDAPDTTDPSAPSNLQAEAISPSQVNLSWNASDDEGGSGLAGYNIYRNGDKINSELITGTTYGDSTVSAGASYSYQVEAVDGAGNISQKSNPADAEVPATRRGDVSGPDSEPDGIIDLRDISYVIRHYNTSDPTADITGPEGEPDGTVDLRDISYLIRNYEQ